MVKARKIPKLVIKEPTPLSRAMANPFLRFGVAGLSAIFTTIILFIFMIFIIDSFNNYRSTPNEVIFNLQTIEMGDPDSRPERVQRPAELVELMEDGEGSTEAEPVTERNTISVEEWQRMFPGQVIIDDNEADPSE